MHRAATALIAAALSLVVVSPANAHQLSKRHARASAVRYLESVVWSLDEAQSGEKLHVRPARFCKRVSHEKVSCPFSVRLVTEPRTVRGALVIHHQRDGLLGYLLPWDPSKICACKDLG